MLDAITNFLSTHRTGTLGKTKQISLPNVSYAVLKYVFPIIMPI